MPQSRVFTILALIIMIHGVLAANINYEILADDGKGVNFDIFNDIIGLLVNKIAALSIIFNI